MTRIDLMKEINAEIANAEAAGMWTFNYMQAMKEIDLKISGIPRSGDLFATGYVLAKVEEALPEEPVKGADIVMDWSGHPEIEAFDAGFKEAVKGVGEAAKGVAEEFAKVVGMSTKAAEEMKAAYGELAGAEIVVEAPAKEEEPAVVLTGSTGEIVESLLAGMKKETLARTTEIFVSFLTYKPTSFKEFKELANAIYTMDGGKKVETSFLRRTIINKFVNTGLVEWAGSAKDPITWK